MLERVTGWAIGSHDGPGAGQPEEADAWSLDQKLGEVIFPVYANGPERWAEVMRYTTA